MKKKNNKAITLIALIITIIVLLILAGITVAQLSGNNLFENAKLAKEKSKNAQEDEDDQISMYSNEIDNWTRAGSEYAVTILYDYTSTGPISSGTITFKDGHTVDEFDELVFLNGYYESSKSKWRAMESFTILRDSWNFAITNGETGNVDEVGFYSYNSDGLRIRNVSKTGFEINTSSNRCPIKIYGIKH